jgi:hypothetical protein
MQHLRTESKKTVINIGRSSLGERSGVDTFAEGKA